MKHFSFLCSLTFLCFIVTSTTAWSQIKLGDNPKTISPYALLELSSTDQGLVLPRMTSAQRDAAFDQTAPVGTVIFNTDDNQLQYFFEMTDPVSRRVTRQWQSASNQVPTSANTTADELAETASSGTLFYDEAAGELLVFDAPPKTWSPVGGNTLSADTVIGGNALTYTQPDGSTAEFNFSTAHQTLVVTPLDDNHQLGLQISDGNAVTLDLSALNTDEQTLTTAFENNTLTTSISNGNSVSADLSALDNSGTDSQTLTTAFTNNILTTSISNGNSVSADLSALDNSGTDSQTLSSSFENNLLTTSISNGNSVSTDLSALNNPGTDNQTLSATALDANDVFTLSIRDGNTVSVNLSTLAGGSNTDSQTLAFGNSATTTQTTLTIAGGNALSLQATSALTFNQTTTNTLEMIVATVDTTRLVDADGDTQIQVEEGGNDDTIRFDTAGTERAIFTTDGDFIVGASQIDNQTGNADDARLIFDKSKGAFRAGTGSTSVWDGTNIGDKSIAAGYNSEASGERSVAFGNHTAAQSYAETAIGSYNTQVTPNATNAWNDADRLLVVGKGSSASTRADALVMLKNGATTLNGALTLDPTGTSSYTLPTHKGAAGQVLTIDDATSGTTTWTTAAVPALVAVMEGGNIGARLINSDPANHGDIGADAIDLSYSPISSTVFGATGALSMAWGQGNTASGEQATVWGENNTALRNYSTAWGQGNTASGVLATVWGADNTASQTYSTAWGTGNIASQIYSTAWGQGNIASSFYSTAWGVDNTASGLMATVWGVSNTASGETATAWGNENTAESYVQTTFGQFNTPLAGDANNWEPTDRLLVIGNGTSNNTRSDALVMLKNGNTTLNGSMTINGNFQATGTLADSSGSTGTLGQVLSSTSTGTAWADATINTDNQNIDALAFDSATSSLTVGITGGTSQTISLAALSTDEQNIDALAFDSATSSLTVGITGGTSQTISLAALSTDKTSSKKFTVTQPLTSKT